MVIVFCKEIRNGVRADKPTLFVKWNRHRTITRSNLQDRVLLFECPDYKINHGFRIAFSLIFWNCSEIFNLKNTVSFIGDDALSFDSLVIKDKHPAVMNIAIYHIFLLIRQ